MAKRREAVRKRLQQGGQQNIATLQQILKLRQSKAKLLGYSSHASFVLERKMAGSAAAVSKFLSKLSKGIAPAVRRDLASLVKAKGGKILFEDVPLYTSKIQQQRFGFNAEELRQYFPLEHVKKEMFEIYGTLLGVKFSLVRGMPKWHQDVELYHVTDSRGSLSSYFYLDLFPRPGKYTHAAMFSIQSKPQVCAMVANFPKPRRLHAPLLRVQLSWRLLHTSSSCPWG
jgi:Zn-dependent oligopeptidase